MRLRGILLAIGMCCSMMLMATPPTDTIRMEVETMFNATGDSICADLIVYNFDSVASLQFSLQFDPTVLRMAEIFPGVKYQATFNGVTPLVDEAWILSDPSNQDALPFFWFENDNPEEGLSLPDGTRILRFCFELIGEPCQASPIFVGSRPTDIEITLANGASLGSGELSLASDTAFIASNTLDIIANHCNASTSTASDGSITFYPCGGMPPYTWEIMGVGSGTLTDGEEERIEGLPQGNYTIKVTDSNGNMTEKVVMVENFPSIDFDLVIDRDLNCFYRENGRVKVENITGGLVLGDYKIDWSTFEFNTDFIRDLGPGTYSASVTDDLGCTVSKEIELSVDTLRGMVEVIDSASCGGSTGVLRLTASGGFPWNTNEYKYHNQFGPSQVGTANVLAGSGTVEIEDSVGCVIDVPYEMPTSGGITATIDVQDVSCFGAGDGRIQVFPSGGSTYFYGLNNMDGTPYMPLGGGNNNDYLNSQVTPPNGSTSISLEVIVTDIATMCEFRDTVVVSEPSPLVVTPDITNPSCAGDVGVIRFDIMGGTMPYTYLWEDNSTSPERTGLGGGTYSVTITDGGSCEYIESFELPDGGELMVNVFVSRAIGCGGSTDGAVTAEPTVAGNYSYSWSDMLDGAELTDMQTLDNVGPGKYYVTVTDIDQNCSKVDSIELFDTAGNIAIEVDSVAPSCATIMDGRLGIMVLNGTQPFRYEWADDPQMDDTKSVLTGLGGGSYAVTVTDANGCSLDTVLMLDVPPAVMLSVSNVVGLDCNGDTTGEATAMASGGQTGAVYSFLWSNGDVQSNGTSTATNVDLPAGRQWVLAGDGACPSDTVFFDISPSPMIVVDTASTINGPSCMDMCDGSINLVASGGNAPYTLVWQDDNSTDPMRAGLCAGTYYVEITDITGCTQLDSIELSNPDSLEVSINPFTTVELTCEDDPGQVGVAVIGGADGAYNYAWSGSSSTTDIAADLQEGTYAVTVTDQAGCSASASYTLTKPAPLRVTLPTIEEPACNGDRTCFTIREARGGVGSSYTFTVNVGPRFPLDSCVYLFAGEYGVSVFDSSGRCRVDTTIEITQPDPIVVDAGPDIEIDLGQSTDPIFADVTGPSLIDTVMWTPGDMVDCLSEDCQTITSMPTSDLLLTVMAMDLNGCTGSDELLIRVNTTRRVVFPNIFTPNEDGFNDRMQVGIGNGVERVLNFQIYDRWGSLVHEEKDYLPVSTDIGGWDGRYQGSLAPAGVYVVVAQILFTDGVIINYDKTVTLVR